MKVRRIRHARLVGEPDGDDVEILIDSKRIANVAADDDKPLESGDWDAAGRTVLPGFINLHSHLFRRRRTDDPASMTGVAEVARALRNAREACAQGITTARELGARDHLDIELRDLIRSGSVVGPRLLVSGRPIMRTGGHNCDFGIEADGPDEVRKAARRELKAGVDVLKVMASWGGIETLRDHTRQDLRGAPAPAPPAYSTEEMRAAVDEAHAWGRRVTVHAESSESIIRAIAAGVDSIEHGTHLTEEAIDALVASDTPLVPTISTVVRRVANARAGQGPDWGADVMGWARLAEQPWIDSLRRAIAAGVRAATGSDAGGDIFMEIELIADAGAGPLGAIRSATSVAADVLGRDDVGSIRNGCHADFAVIDGKPERDIRDISQVVAVIREGDLLQNRTARDPV